MAIRTSDLARLTAQLNGQPLHRSTVVCTAATPKSNISTSGGASVAYTFKGGEVVMIQSDVAVYIEVIAVGSMTASGALAVKLDAGEKFYVTLGDGVTSISCDAVSGTATVKMFQMV